ncbi:MAG: DUF1508 domain-containing protein [Myxococcales bacterium]|nr:DUF1508 domain-containing protein [Myxococcales bacterium]
MTLNIRALALVAVAALSLSATACTAPVDTSDEVEAEETAQLLSKSAYFETFEGMDGQYYFHLMAANGANVLRSEGYVSRSNAERGAQALMGIARDKRNFEVLEAKNGEFYFNVVSPNGEIVGTSELYASKSNADRGARTVRSLVRLIAIGAEAKAAPQRETFEIFKGEDRKTYFRLRAGNGEIMLASQGYTAKSSAWKGIDSVMENGSTEGRFQTFEAYDGGWGVRLVAKNGEIIARGETYSTKSNATRAVRRLTEILGGELTVTEL